MLVPLDSTWCDEHFGVKFVFFVFGMRVGRIYVGWILEKLIPIDVCGFCYTFS